MCARVCVCNGMAIFLICKALHILMSISFLILNKNPKKTVALIPIVCFELYLNY